MCMRASGKRQRPYGYSEFMKTDESGGDNTQNKKTPQQKDADENINVTCEREQGGDALTEHSKIAENQSADPDLKHKSPKDVVMGGVLGLFIGLAVIIPGVSGSAVAIIMKLYEKLLYAISNIFRKFRKCVIFLLPVAVGAAAGFVFGFFVVKTLLDVMMFAVVALFAGLMLGAFPSVSDQIKGEKHTPPRIMLFIAGLIVPVAISLISVFAGGGRQSLENPQAWQYLLYFALGFAVALTQLVPGLSATALLMTTGHYVPLIESASLAYWQTNPEIFAVYACLVAGFVAGLLCFSKLISLLLKKMRAATFHAVAGLALGSVVTMFFNPELYAEYLNWYGGERFGPDLLFGSALFVAGIIVAYLFVRLQRKKTLPLKNNY